MKINASLLILFAAALNALAVFAQPVNVMKADDKLGKPVLCGECTRSGLQQGDFGALFKQYHHLYAPDPRVVARIRGLADGAGIMIVLGTWCSDSQEQVPRFFKVLDKARFPKNKVSLVCVDSAKEACGVDISSLDIHKVPTFIVYRNGREMGRIIETPYQTLEQDLLMFLLE